MRHYLLYLLLFSLALPAFGAQSEDFTDQNGQKRLSFGDGLQVEGQNATERLTFILEQRPQWGPRFEGLDHEDRQWQLGATTLLIRRYRFQGLPLQNAALAIHLDSAQRVIAISRAHLDHEIRHLDWQSTAPHLNQWHRRIGEIATEKGNPPQKSLHTTPEGIRATYSISARVEGAPFEWVFDAQNGAFLFTRPLASHARAAAAEDFVGSGWVFEDSYLDGPTITAPLPHLVNEDVLTGRWVDVWGTSEGGQPQKRALASTDITYKYEPHEEYSDGEPAYPTMIDPFAEVMMYYHVNLAHDYFNDLGYRNDDPLTGIDRMMRATVNYHGRNVTYFNNAYYSYGTTSPGEIVFGQGQATDFSYDSSVIYHEYGHAVVNGSSNYVNYCLTDLYGNDCTQGGLNEGSADYFASSLRDDPMVGEYAIGEWAPGYERDLRLELTCPGDLYGEEHEDGEIWGSTLWAIREALLEFGDENSLYHADSLILATVMTPIDTQNTGGSAFAFAGNLLKTLAEASVGETLNDTQYARLVSILADRGVLDCQRFVDLEGNITRYGAFSSADAIRAGQTPSGLQYRIQLGEEATGFSIKIEDLTSTTIHLRKGAPVEYDVETATVKTSDTYYASTEFTLNEGDGFEPGATYYISFTAPQTLATALYGHYYRITLLPKYKGTTFNEEEGSSGCACNINPPAGPSQGVILEGLALLLLGYLRPRRK